MMRSAGREALQQLSEWQGLLAQNVPIARQILRKVLEGRLVFVPRHEGDEHWYELGGKASLTKFFTAVPPLKAMASPRGKSDVYTDLFRRRGRFAMAP